MASPRVLNPRVQVAPERQQGRVTRMPATPFNLIHKPFQLQPCGLFPVLPGETMKNMHLQVQCWTDPLAAVLKNTGWHFEYYAFYAKMRDLPGWEDASDGLGKDLIDMFISNESLASWQEAAVVPWSYCAKGGVDYVREITRRVVDSYFREEGETYATAAIDNVPIVKLYGRGRRDVLDKLTMATAYADRRQNLDFDGSGTITVDDVELAYREWAAKREGTQIDMDFEDWIRAAGGKAVVRDDEREDLHLPEDIAHFREWTYPTNTVEPSTGVPAVAAGWRLTKESRQAIRFPEWGWVICYIVARPKMLLLNQTGLFAGMQQTRDAFFPPQLDAREYEPHLLIDDATGPLATVMDAGNDDYYIDLRDLYTNGEQFVNYAPAQASGAFATLPVAGGAHRYPSSADAMSVFTDTTNGRIRTDGVCTLTIAGQPVTKESLRQLTLGKS